MNFDERFFSENWLAGLDTRLSTIASLDCGADEPHDIDDDVCGVG